MPSKHEIPNDPHSPPGQRQLLADVQAERDQYRRLLYPAVWQQFTEEELQRFAEDESEEGTQRLEHFLGELEDILNGNKPAGRP